MPALVLIGAPGAGKSTVGRLVAQELGTGFLDTDDLVEEVAGMPLPEIFVVHGEPRFRELEEQVVRSALTSDGVVSLGGGAVMAPSARRALAGAPVVWLRVADGEAVKRVGLSGPRPVLFGNVRATWSALLAQRAEVYEQLATWQVDTTGREPAQVAAELLALLGRGDD